LGPCCVCVAGGQKGTDWDLGGVKPCRQGASATDEGKEFAGRPAPTGKKRVGMEKR
tara:strand:+ start:8326 stop:8493 length:168 start_codon:yes stop_codon:yes gene_type:complete